MPDSPKLPPKPTILDGMTRIYQLSSLKRKKKTKQQEIKKKRKSIFFRVAISFFITSLVASAAWFYPNIQKWYASVPVQEKTFRPIQKKSLIIARPETKPFLGTDSEYQSVDEEKFNDGLALAPPEPDTDYPQVFYEPEAVHEYSVERGPGSKTLSAEDLEPY